MFMLKVHSIQESFLPTSHVFCSYPRKQFIQYKTHSAENMFNTYAYYTYLSILWLTKAGGKTLIQYINLVLQKVRQGFHSCVPPRLPKVLWGYLSNSSTQSSFKHPNTMATWNPGQYPNGGAGLWTSAQSLLCTYPWATSLIQWPFNPTRGRTEHFFPGTGLMKIHNIKKCTCFLKVT